MHVQIEHPTEPLDDGHRTLTAISHAAVVRTGGQEAEHGAEELLTPETDEAVTANPELWEKGTVGTSPAVSRRSRSKAR